MRKLFSGRPSGRACRRHQGAVRAERDLPACRRQRTVDWPSPGPTAARAGRHSALGPQGPRADRSRERPRRCSPAERSARRYGGGGADLLRCVSLPRPRTGTSSPALCPGRPLRIPTPEQPQGEADTFTEDGDLVIGVGGGLRDWRIQPPVRIVRREVTGHSVVAENPRECGGRRVDRRSGYCQRWVAVAAAPVAVDSHRRTREPAR